MNSALFSFIRKSYAFIAPFLKPFEKRWASRYGNNSSFAPIFIVGPPRSGSTILYQYLTNKYNVRYFDNYSHLLYRTVFLGDALSYKRFGYKGHGTSNSDLGSTVQFGWHAPAENYNFWYRWLPRSPQQINAFDIPESTDTEVRFWINAIQNRHGQPILIKSLSNSLRIQWLLRVFPNARFIHIQRNRTDNARSIYKARKSLATSSNEWWSIRPEGWESQLGKPEEELINWQIDTIEKQLEKFFVNTETDKYFPVQYEEFCENPEYWGNRIATFMDTEERDDYPEIKIRKPANKYHTNHNN